MKYDESPLHKLVRYLTACNIYSEFKISQRGVPYLYVPRFYMNVCYFKKIDSYKIFKHRPRNRCVAVVKEFKSIAYEIRYNKK